MCIRCNVPDGPDGPDRAQLFLDAFARSREAMLRAAEAMDAILRTDLDPDVRRRYDRTHKAMRRQIAEWNSLEQAPEADPVPGAVA